MKMFSTDVVDFLISPSEAEMNGIFQNSRFTLDFLREMHYNLISGNSAWQAVINIITVAPLKINSNRRILSQFFIYNEDFTRFGFAYR